MKNLAIIQARTGSTRLPNKVLMKFEDKTVLEHVIDRVQKSKLVSDIVVATTLENDDINIVKVCSNKNIKTYCGSVNDVLDRFYQISKILRPDNIIRITADCPVIDPDIIDLLIDKHLQHNSDYTSNVLDNLTYPDGQDVEVFKSFCLEEAFFYGKLLSEREHVTPYIRNNKKLKLFNVENSIDLSDKRWTLDNIEDFNLLKIIFANLYKKNNFFGMNEILEFIKLNTEIETINHNIKRNEGYKKSLINDNEI